MANQIATILKSEISRLARKEIRAEVSSLKKTSAQHRTTIASLRRELEEVKKQLRNAVKGKPQVSEPLEEAGVRHRFRRGGLITHRKQLGLSATDYGKLVGVTGQTIYKWEDSTHPRASQLAALAQIRGMGKREALHRLQELAAAAPKKNGRSKPATRAARSAR